MAVQHSALTGANLHEPKGVAAAAVAKAYISDGAGSGSWLFPVSFANLAFFNLSVPFLILVPTTYAKVGPTTVSDVAREFTHSTTGRLTYTGAATRRGFARAVVTLRDTIGDTDVQAAIFKNGALVANSDVVARQRSTDKSQLTVLANMSLVNTDYIEVFVKTLGSGDVEVFQVHLEVSAFPS